MADTQHHILENPSYRQDCLGSDGVEGGFVFNKIKVENYPQSEKTGTQHKWASCVYVGGISKGELTSGLKAFGGFSPIQKLWQARGLGLGRASGDTSAWRQKSSGQLLSGRHRTPIPPRDLHRDPCCHTLEKDRVFPSYRGNTPGKGGRE